MVQGIFCFEIAVNFRDKVPKYYVFWTGKHDYHMMDWAGCNFRRVQYPKKSFATYQEAFDFATAYQKERDDEVRQAAIINNRKTNERFRKPGQPPAADSTWGMSWSLEGNGIHTGEYGDRVFMKSRVVDHNLSPEEFEMRRVESENLKAGRDAWDCGCPKCGLATDKCECDE